MAKLHVLLDEIKQHTRAIEQLDQQYTQLLNWVMQLTNTPEGSLTTVIEQLGITMAVDINGVAKVPMTNYTPQQIVQLLSQALNHAGEQITEQWFCLHAAAEEAQQHCLEVKRRATTEQQAMAESSPLTPLQPVTQIEPIPAVPPTQAVRTTPV